MIQDMNDREINKRNQTMVMEVFGGRTLQSVGDEFGISRERVRQIFKDRTGTSRDELKRADKFQKKINLMQRVRFLCKQCGDQVMFSERSVRKFCSETCWRKYYSAGGAGFRNLKVKLICSGCGIEYHPHRNIYSPSILKGKTLKKNYCTQQCYMEHGAFGRIS
jgi:AraC-like DNA-binding protein